MRKRRVKKPPLALLLPLTAVRDSYGLLRLIAQDQRLTRYQIKVLHGMFGLHDDERDFAEALLARKPQFWVFRTNQQAFCGDFVVIDMSCPDLAKRRVFVLELKQNTRLKLGVGPGNQFAGVEKVLAYIARTTEAIPRQPEYQKVLGDMGHLLAYLGCPPSDVRALA